MKIGFIGLGIMGSRMAANLQRHGYSLSCEPLIGSLASIDLRGIHWVIVGGESGPHSRPMHVAWVQEIFRACRKHEVPFFFKQWGGVAKGSYRATTSRAHIRRDAQFLIMPVLSNDQARC